MCVFIIFIGGTELGGTELGAFLAKGKVALQDVYMYILVMALAKLTD